MLRGKKKHEEFVHSNVKFDYQRRDAGVKGFSGEWDASGAAHLYQTAALLDSRYKALSDQLGHDSRIAYMFPPKPR